MRGPSQPVSAYSGNEAWGQGQSPADTGNVIASPGSHPQQRLRASPSVVASPEHGVCSHQQASVGHFGVSHSLGEVQPPMASHKSPLCPGSQLSSEGEAQGETLSRMGVACLFLELPQWLPNPLLTALVGAWLLFCPLCETQSTCHIHRQIKDFLMQKK